MKVLICGEFLESTGEPFRRLEEFIRYFQSRGHEVHIAGMRNQHRFPRFKNVHHHRFLPIHSLFSWFIKWIIFKNKIDQVYSFGGFEHADFFIFTENTGYNLEAPLNAKIIVPTDKIKQDLCKKHDLPSSEAITLKPSFNSDRYFPNTEEKFKLKKKFQFPDKVTVVFFTEEDEGKSGIYLFHRAINLLEPRIRCMANFRIIGDEKHSMINSAYIIFDPMPEKKEEYFNAIDIFVLPAIEPITGRPLMWAMGCGAACLSTHKALLSPLLIKNSTRLVTQDRHPQELADILTMLIEDEDFRIQTGKDLAELVGRESEGWQFKDWDEKLQNDQHD